MTNFNHQIASGEFNFNVINALLAKPPFTRAIDVCDEGQLLAGVTYNTIDECVGDFTNKNAGIKFENLFIEFLTPLCNP